MRSHGRGGTRARRGDGGQAVEEIVTLAGVQPHGPSLPQGDAADQRGVGRVTIGRGQRGLSAARFLLTFWRDTGVGITFAEVVPEQLDERFSQDSP